jgi:hypothetical protein
MADSTFSREQVAALEKILGVKLPAQGFTLEIKPLGTPLADQELDGVVGGSADAHRTASQAAPGSPTAGLTTEGPSALQIPISRWSAKI